MPPTGVAPRRGSHLEAVVEARTTGDCESYGDLFVDRDSVGSCEEGDVDPVVGGGPEVREIDGDSATVEVLDFRRPTSDHCFG